jgi:hypothetical protein
MRTLLLLPLLFLVHSGFCLQLKVFPSVVVQHESATFTLESPDPAPIVVALNQVQLAKVEPENGTAIHLPLAIDHGGLLTFSQNETTISLAIVEPEAEGSLHQRDGHLFVDETPALLLSRQQPRYIGRAGWEALGFVGQLFAWTGGPESGTTLLSPQSIASKLSGDWRLITPEKGLYEIKGAIAALSKEEASDRLILALSTKDLDRGMPGGTLQKLISWLLQAAHAKGYKQRTLLGLPFTKNNLERFPAVTPELRRAALSTGSLFLPIPPERKNWADSIEQSLSHPHLR